jgi:hypothetical protein
MRYLFLLFICTNLHAQNKNIDVELSKKLIDTTIVTSTGEQMRITQKSNQLPEVSISKKNNMPNALSGKIYTQTYSISNQSGFDLYNAQLDNMCVLKPDSSNLASLKANTITTQPAKAGTGFIIEYPKSQFKLIPKLNKSEEKLLKLLNNKQ